VHNISNNTVPWTITDTILRPGEPSPGIGIGSHIKLTDSQWFEVEGFSRRQKGRLEKIYGYEQEYVQFILKAHTVGREDIYGSHLSKSTLSSPSNSLTSVPFIMFITTSRSVSLDELWVKRLTMTPFIPHVDLLRYSKREK
jgi:hypothetical protein